jgi:hypothetical protein
MRRIVGAMVAVVAMLAFFTGCYGNDPNVAVVVGDKTITEADLVVYTDAINIALEEAQNTTKFSKESTLSNGIIGALTLQAPDQSALRALVSQTALDEFARQPVFVALAAQPKLEPIMSELLASQLVISVVQYGDQEALAALQAAAAEVPVKLNPRYGTWKPQELSFSGNGSLSIPADSDQ